MTQLLTPPAPAPPSLPQSIPDTVALLTIHNEEDILPATLEHLSHQNIGTYILDNWSTDRSAAIAASFHNRGLVGIEKFPAQPHPRFDQIASLHRKEQLALHLAQHGARWIMHYDADELRESPWPGVSLRDGLRRVESEGYNAINHELLLFVPTHDHFHPARPLAEQFPFYLPSNTPTNHQIKAWIQPDHPIDLASSCGHLAQFPGRRVYPIPFLIRHYPIRSTEHARRKIFRERLPRYPESENRLGWHTHYSHLPNVGQSFAYDPADPRLKTYDDLPFKREFLARFYAPTPGSLQSTIEQLTTQLEQSRLEIARLRQAQNALRYVLADHCHTALRRTGPLYRLLKKALKS